MPNPAQFLPYIYVNKLRSLSVPGYTGYPGGIVALTRYMSANTMFGGASAAATLRGALMSLPPGQVDTSRLAGALSRVFSGQGRPGEIIEVMQMIVANRAALSKTAALAKLLAENDYLQALCDAGFFGQDCIGFVGTYLAEAGVDPGYQASRPIDYSSRFTMVQSLAEVDRLCVLMLTNGMHIQIVDWVHERSATRMVIDICQSSNLKDQPASQGPQCNERVTLTAGGGSYLDVDAFRLALSKRTRYAEYASNAEKPTDNGYETFLRKELTTANRQVGWRNGAIFQLSGGGKPSNPVAGSVYVGKMQGLEVAGG